MNSKTATSDILSAAATLQKKGWVPATSGNFSRRVAENRVAITVSGANLASLSDADVMEVDLTGTVVDDQMPSAETKLHLQLYARDPGIGAVLHTHSLYSALVTQTTERISFSNLEILKAFAGIETHEACVTLPVFANTQNMEELADIVERHMEREGQGHAYLIQGHGAYVWGADMRECLRHLEAVEFLLEYYWQSKR